jgi:nucleoid DNA-binding protein
MMSFAEIIKEFIVAKHHLSLKNLGVFSLKTESAQIHPIIHEFVPPMPMLTFEQQAHCETSLSFVEFFAKQQKIGIDEARQTINAFVDNMHKSLTTNKQFVIETLGELLQKDAETIMFRASEALVLKHDAFGMPSFVLQKNRREQASTTVSQTATPLIKTHVLHSKETNKTTQKRNKTKRKAFVIIPTLLLLLVTALFVFSHIGDSVVVKFRHLFTNTHSEPIEDAQQAENSTNNPPTESTHSDTLKQPMKNTHTFVSENTRQERVDLQSMKYFVVADCFSNLDLAKKRVSVLQKEGYQSDVVGQTRSGLHIVCYAGFNTREEAEAKLEQIKQTNNKHAWLYIK